MIAQTEQEIAKFYNANKNYFGLTFESSDRFVHKTFMPVYHNPESKCVGFALPDSPSGYAYLASILPSLLTGFDSDNWSGGAVIYQDFDVWNHRNNVEGWTMIERIRAGYGELRPFREATVNAFRDNDNTILPAFLLAPLIYGWDAHYVPLDRGCFASISHDGYWTVTTETEQDYTQLQDKLIQYDKDHWIKNQRLLGSKA